jgi:hypothetical protein
MKHIKLFENFSNEGYNYDPKDGESIESWWDRLSLHDVGNVSVEIGCNFRDLSPKKPGSSEYEKHKWNDLSKEIQDSIKDEYFKANEKETGSYPAPKFARKPAPDDKGYNYVAKQFGATPAPKKKNKGSRTE